MSAAAAAAAANLMASIIGTKQTADSAPAYDAGQSGGFLQTGIEIPEKEQQSFQALLAQILQPQGAGNVLDQAQAGLPPPTPAPQVRANDVNDLVGLPNLQEMAQQQMVAGTPGIGDMMGPPEAETPNFLGGLGEKAGGFFGNMDQNLQSPSKTIGMGLLGQIDPRLGYAGLLSMGLFGDNKIFGK